MKLQQRLMWDNIPDNAWDNDPRCPYRYGADEDDDEEESTREMMAEEEYEER